jgi:hypothetical protein
MNPTRLAPLVLLAAAACGSSHHDSGCNTADPNACSAGAVCEPVAGSVPACFAPLVVKGQVTDLSTTLAVSGARVVALDANRAPASNVATTDGSGNFTLTVPATRDASGKPVSASVTLRADAQNYQSFPGGIRTSLPIDLSSATYSSNPSQWIVTGQLTAVGLIPLQSTANLFTISGTVAVPPSRVGVLVVAAPGTGNGAACVVTPPSGPTSPPTGITAIAGSNGGYTIFNVPGAALAIDYCVNAYGQGVNYTTGSAAISTASAIVDLAIKNTTTAAFGGNLIFNQATAPTSVALVVLSTYDPVLDRGESPPGLVAQVPSGANTYSFTGVPDGSYLALAAFGIDGDVRDQSGTGGTTPPLVTVTNGSTPTPAGFKITGAVDLTSIDGQTPTNTGAPIVLTNNTTHPTFEWGKQASSASAATFRTDVFDAYGTQVWTTTQSGTGSGPFTATYAGTALTSGMYYQLRVSALDGSGFLLSQTEDLKGVFFKP